MFFILKTWDHSLSKQWLGTTFLLSCLLFAEMAQGQIIYRDMPMDVALQELGEPQNRVARGTREILSFENDITIEFRNELVWNTHGIELSPKPIDSNTTSPATTELNDIVAPTAIPIEEFDAPKAASPDTSERFADSEDHADNTEWNEEDAEGSQDEATPNWLNHILAFTFTFIFGSIALNFAFKSVGMSTVIPQILLIILGFSVISSLLDITDFARETRDRLWIDHIIAYLMLSTLIYKLSDTTQGLTAMKIAFATGVIAKIMAFLAILTVLHFL